MVDKKMFYGVLAVCALTGLVIGFTYMDMRQESGVNIFCDVVSSQGAAENLTGMERVKVHGMVCNTGDKEAKNVTASVIFTDTTHNEVVRKTVIEGVDLLPNGVQYEEFDTVYFRELTIPKTSVDVTIQIDWGEDGQLRTMTIPRREHEAITEEEKQEAVEVRK